MSVNAISQDSFYDIQHISEIRLNFTQTNWDATLDSLFLNYGEDGRLIGNISIDGNLLKNVGVRYKGYSSWNVDDKKSPFNVELEYTQNNRNYLGYTKLKLSNVIHDPSFIREVLSYEIARKYMPASKANFANIYVNDTLLGLYTNVESVDKIFIGKHFSSSGNSFFKGAPENLIYPFGQNANLAYTHGTDSSGYMPYYKLESDLYGWKDLLQLIYTLNVDTTHIPEILNVDRALWMHAFNYVLLNLDSYIGYSQNYYLYRDDNGQFNTIPWDFNMSFGSFRHSDGTMLNLTIAKMKQLSPLQILNTTPFTPRPLIKNLLQNPTYKRMYLAHMRTIIDENFRNNEYYIRGQIIQTLIDSSVKNDTNKFYPYADFQNNLNSDVGTTADQYPGIKSLMDARISYLDTFPGFSGAPMITAIQHTPLHPKLNNDVWINATILSSVSQILSYRFNTNGLFTSTLMYDDGNHQDGIAGDNIYGAKIILSGKTIQYYIYAENDSAGRFSPERAAYEFLSIQPGISPSDFAINEFMATPQTVASNPNGNFENWIEFINTTNEKMNLKDVYLSNDKNNLLKWQFPDTTLNPKAYLIVWADNTTSQNGIHANFKLSENGGQFFVTNADLAPIDNVTYLTQVSGMTTGRFPNGSGPFVNMQPTFSKCNSMITTDKSVSIFPNPAFGKVYLEVWNQFNPFTFEIYSANGQIMKTEYFSSGVEEFSFTTKEIDISNFQKGVYILKISITCNACI